MSDYDEKCAAAKEQVVRDTAELSKELIISAYRKSREYISANTKRHETDFKVINETLEKLLASSMYNLFLSMEQESSDAAIREIANKAAHDFGIAKLDPNKVIQ